MSRSIKYSDDEIINYYLSEPMNYEKCANHFNICQPTLGKILDRNNIQRYTKSKIYNPNFNENFFKDIHTFQCEFKAYFLGLLITDGNVFDKRGESAISITLQEQDEYILYQFLEILNSNRSLSRDGRGCSTASVKSNIMAEDLKKFGIVPNKTLKTRLPIFDNEIIMSYLMRGILDGDGCICYSYYPSIHKYSHVISFCGTYELMNDINLYLHKVLNLGLKSVYTYKDRHLSEIKYRSLKEVIKLGNWIYQYPMNICMYRKYIKFLSLKEYFNIKY